MKYLITYHYRKDAEPVKKLSSGWNYDSDDPFSDVCDEEDIINLVEEGAVITLCVPLQITEK